LDAGGHLSVTLTAFKAALFSNASITPDAEPPNPISHDAKLRGVSEMKGHCLKNQIGSAFVELL